ncbi:MAG: phosphate signaling complex PhoU family protein [Fervidobacterium sp.]
MKWIVEKSIGELKKAVTKEAWYVEDILRLTSEAFKERKIETAKIVEERCWDVYNEYLNIVRGSQIIVGTCNPEGYALRFLFGSVLVSKILLDASSRLKDISDDIKMLVKEPEMNQSAMVPEMFSFVQKMMRRALRVYVDQNIEGAQGICSQDAFMDEMFLKFKDEIITLIQNNPRVVKRGLLLMDISKALEEICDFAVQIIEITFYILTGKNYTCYGHQFQLFSVDVFKSMD